MKLIKLIGTDEKIYYEKLKNGLDVYLVPYKNKKNYYAVYGTKYGSINLDFKYNKEFISTNKGIAHFLEHKLFEQENKEDPFEFFSKSGTECNASTSNKKTVYYIYGINSLEDNLNYLIDCINNPYFTDKNVEKEKGIIIQEIKMYDDDPDWMLYEEMLKTVFKNHPIRYDIAGYEDTVNKITKEELYKCYETFYNPENMYLVVTGNFNKDEIMNIIKNNSTLKNKKKKKVILKEIDEPIEIYEKEKIIKHENIKVPKVGISIKIPVNEELDKFKTYAYLNILLNILYGSSSDFREELFKDKCATSLYMECTSLEKFYLIQLVAESKKPNEFKERVLNHFKDKIDIEDFNRQIKVQIASLVMSSDNIDTVGNDIISDLVNYNKVINNRIDLLKNLDFKELIKLQKDIDINNSTYVVLDKK